MRNITLILPAPEHEAAVMEFLAEFRANGEAKVSGSGGLHHEKTYADWLAKLADWKNPALLPPDRTVSTTFLAMRESRTVRASEVVGLIDVRHSLNDILMQTGGHIGYSVRPAARGQGIATKMLALALDFCRDLGIDRALVTCNRDNTASARVIVKNGGVLENEVREPDGTIVQRYWIAL